MVRAYVKVVHKQSAVARERPGALAGSTASRARMDVAHRNSTLLMRPGHLFAMHPSLARPRWPQRRGAVDRACSFAASVAGLLYDCLDTLDQADKHSASRYSGT